MNNKNLEVVEHSVGSHSFFGSEFMLWLWYLVDNKMNKFETIRGELMIELDDKIIIDGVSSKVSISTNRKINLDEVSKLALQSVQIPTEVKLTLAEGDINSLESYNKVWTFSLKRKGFKISGVKIPSDGYSTEFDRFRSLQRLTANVDALLKVFMEIRLDKKKWSELCSKIEAWVSES